jgi:demethylmenaquinone methyltransferase/2-methoxy-6-polyprenyl-1,4-benzoquinol methylase
VNKFADLYEPNFIRQYFNNLSKDYDTAEKISFYLLQCWRNQILQQAHIKLGATVYDIGCGGGNNFDALTRKIGCNGKIIGVDFSNRMIEKSAQRISQNQWKHIQLVEGDFLESALLAGDSDNVFGTFCLKTMSDKQFQLLANQVWTVLKPTRQCVLGEFSLPKSRFRACLT